MTTLNMYANVAARRVTDSIDLPTFMSLCSTPIVAQLIAAFRAGDAASKKRLPAVTYMGRSTSGQRRAADMVPTGLVMLDVDHVAEDRLPALREHLMQHIDDAQIVLLHITPSGRGMRIVAAPPVLAGSHQSIEAYSRLLVDTQRQLADSLTLADYGDVDECVKDLSRLSFMPQATDIVFINERLFLQEPPTIAEPTTNSGEATNDTAANTEGTTAGAATDDSEARPNADFRYGDMLVRDIAAEYVKCKGEPVDGTRHHFYNRMVIDFRNICNNSPEVLVDVLPRFGESRSKRYSQCKSICQRNNSTALPKAFWAWLKDKGFYVEPMEDTTTDDDTAEDPYAAEHELLDRMPALPPVIREYVNAAPREFKIPTLFALLPVMGTVATHLQARYYDGEMHTPSFFTVIYAHAASGKSFVNRFLELDVERSTPSNLLHEIVRRDYISNCRINLWNDFSNAKGANEKGKPRPKVSTRLMETITSQADMLPVMKDNQGMHMFMFAPEIDTLAKGMRSGGGGDKNDIFRVAWDNGMYGQSYRNSISFRGKVAMYLNVLATGTPAQCARLFSDVENGLVSRCLFTDLGQQEYAKFQPWKKLNAVQLQTIDNWRRRCDAATYQQTLNFNMELLPEFDDEEKFDENVPWEYQFRGRTEICLDGFNKKLLRWLEVQRQMAEKDADRARDAFRKRAAGNAFRVALLCHSCWKRVTQKEERIIEDFALWFADLALMKFLKRWGDEYNTAVIEADRKVQGRSIRFVTLYDTVPKEFTKGDLHIVANRKCVKTPVRNIVARWVKAGLVQRTDTGWKKVG